MLFPYYRQFAALARNATLVPVAKTVAADLRTPVSAFLSVAAREPNAFLLESVEGGEKVGRYTFLGARPYMILRAHGSQITLEQNGKKEAIRGVITLGTAATVAESAPRRHELRLMHARIARSSRTDRCGGRA